jgi:hypothetical protein
MWVMKLVIKKPSEHKGNSAAFRTEKWLQAPIPTRAVSLSVVPGTVTPCNIRRKEQEHYA